MRSSLTAVFIYLLLDTACFRSGFYNNFLEPASYAGTFRTREKDARIKFAESKERPVIMLGDSRISEGFSAKIFDETSNKSVHLKALNASMPGSSLRVWYYLLKRLDPSSDRFSIIVIPVQSYACKTLDVDPINRPLDLNFLLANCNSLEIMDVAATFTSPVLMIKSLMCSFVRGWGFQEDLSAFALAPRERLKKIRAEARCDWISDYLYPGKDASLKDIKYSGRELIAMPLSIDAETAERIRAQFDPLKSQAVTTEQVQYCTFWLQRFADRYKKSKTKIVIVKIPCEPFLANPNDDIVCAQLKAICFKNDIEIIPAEKLSGLNQPRFFADDLHLNKEGRTILSQKIATLINYQIVSNGK